MGMVDIAKKIASEREAVVEAQVMLNPSVINTIKKKKISKGDVLQVAEVAGILAAKKTHLLIPLCHPLALEHIGIEFSFYNDHIKIRTTVKAEAKTGVEMEAFVATAIASLTIYDMCKPLDREIVISDIKLLKKTGGKSGPYVRKFKI